jgi:hypothetical protein
MSEDADKEIEGTPEDSAAPGSPVAPDPAPSPAGTEQAAPASAPATGQIPSFPPQPAILPRPPGPPIDYAMPLPKKPLTIPKNLGCLVKMMFGFTVLLLMGYFALMALNPKARQWALKGGGPTPFKAVNQILAIPAQAVGKTTDVVVSNDARVGQLDNLIAEEEGKGRKGGNRVVNDPFATSPAAPAKAGKAGATGTAESKEGEPQKLSADAILAMNERLSKLPASGTGTASSPLAPTPKPVPPPPPAPAQLKLPGDILITSASPAGTPAPTAPFFYWIVNLNINGVTQSTPPRLMLNNRLIYVGDEVNRTLGIVFAELDTANKLIVFRDQTGAIVTRSY